MAVIPAAASATGVLPQTAERTVPLFRERVYHTKDDLLQSMHFFERFIGGREKGNCYDLPQLDKDKYAWKSMRKYDLAPLDWERMPFQVMYIKPLNAVAISYWVGELDRKVQRVTVFLLGEKLSCTPSFDREIYAPDRAMETGMSAYEFKVTDLLDCEEAGAMYRHLCAWGTPKSDLPVLSGAVTSWKGKFVHREDDLKSCMHHFAEILRPDGRGRHGYGDLPPVTWDWENSWSLKNYRIKVLDRKQLIFPLMTMYEKNGNGFGGALAVVFNRREGTRQRATVFSLEKRLDLNFFYIHHLRPQDTPGENLTSYHLEMTDILDAAQAHAIDTAVQEYAKDAERLSTLAKQAPRWETLNKK